MSLQALLILFVFPEGIIKRYASTSFRYVILTCVFIYFDFPLRIILRIYFSVLGLVVTTEGQNKQQKVN